MSVRKSSENLQEFRTPNENQTKRNVEMYRRKMKYYLNMFKEPDSDDEGNRNVEFKKVDIGCFDENDKENVSGVSYIKETPNLKKHHIQKNNLFGSTSSHVSNLGQEKTLLQPNQQHLETIFEKNDNSKNNENNLKRYHLVQKNIKDVKFLINEKKYELIQKLGFGGSSTVFECFDLSDQKKVAIKAIKLTRNGMFLDEVFLLRKLQGSEYIIRMYDYEQHDNHLYVVLEKGDCDLSRIIKNSVSNKPLPIPSIIFYWYQMLKAVQYIHSQGIIHSDLKPSNFLLVEGVLKLIDFGIASVLPNDMTSVIKNELIGTFSYISPEAIIDSRNSIDEFSPNAKPKYKVNFKSDVWSLGCILYQMIYKKSPFQHIGNIQAKILVIIDKNHEIIYKPIDKMYDNFIRTIRKCLIYEYKERISIDELLDDLSRRFMC